MNLYPIRRGGAEGIIRRRGLNVSLITTAYPSVSISTEYAVPVSTSPTISSCFSGPDSNAMPLRNLAGGMSAILITAGGCAETDLFKVIFKPPRSRLQMDQEPTTLSPVLREISIPTSY